MPFSTPFLSSRRLLHSPTTLYGITVEVTALQMFASGPLFAPTSIWNGSRARSCLAGFCHCHAYVLHRQEAVREDYRRLSTRKENASDVAPISLRQFLDDFIWM